MLAVTLSGLAPARGLLATPPGHGHGFHVPMPDQEMFAEFRVADGNETKSTEAVLELSSTSAPAELDQSVALPAGRGVARLTRYLPRAKRVQNAVADPAGQPALLLDIVGKKQSFTRWLVAGDAAHNRLTSRWEPGATKPPNLRRNAPPCTNSSSRNTAVRSRAAGSKESKAWKH